MFGLGLPEIIVIFVIALVVFGPKKLPELGKSIGRAMAEFKKASDEFQESVRAEMKEVEKTANVKEELQQIEKIAHADYLTGTPAGADAAAGQTSHDPSASVKEEQGMTGTGPGNKEK